MDTKKKQELFAYLWQYVTENKKQKIDQVIGNRTNHLTVVLEEIYQSHNASAVMRSAECFGVQNVHVVQNRNEFNPKQAVSMGSTKWLSVHSYTNISDCYKSLKQQGYRIVATTVDPKACLLPELAVDKKTALVFGTEQQGLTEAALAGADQFMTIPMYGFTESFNVSVSVAICLYHLTEKLRKSDIAWKLSDDELFELRLQWVKAAVKNSAQLEKRFFGTD